jgi:hypothetical protein
LLNTNREIGAKLSEHLGPLQQRGQNAPDQRRNARPPW